MNCYDLLCNDVAVSLKLPVFMTPADTGNSKHN